MKINKKFSFLLALMLVLSIVIVGCGKNNSGNANNTGNTGKEDTDKKETPNSGDEGETKTASKIIVFQSKVEIVDDLEKLAKDYKAETGVEVEVWGTTGDDYLQQLKIKLGGEGPTIFSLAPGSESNDLSAYLADISDLTFVKDIAAGMADEKDGKVVGIPYTMEGFGVVYNKSMIDASKVTDLNSFVQMLKDQKAAGVNGFSLSQESYFLIGHILNTPFALQADPIDFINKLVAGEIKMKDYKEFVEFADLMVAVRENTVNPLEVKYDTQTGDFATKKTASIHQGNWSYGMFKDYNVDFEMGMMPLPIVGNDKIAASVPTCWYVNSQAKEEEVKAAKDFLNWLYTSETGTKYLLEDFGFIPILSTMKSPSLDPLSTSVSEYAAEGKTIGWPNAHWPAGIVDVHLVPVAQEFFTTDMTAEMFLDSLTNAFVEAGK